MITTVVDRWFGCSLSLEEIFENAIIYSDVMKLDLGLNVYEEIIDKVKLKKHLEEK